jgi:1-acyl-sn-glycerol-3-phosphate acyltransferase
MILSWLKIGLIFLYTAIVAVLTLLSIPFDRDGHLYHACAKLFARGVLVIGGVKVVVEGIQHLQPSRSYVYISNHVSQFDIPSIIAGIPDKIRLVYKKELEKVPFMGWALKFGRIYIGINRARGIDAAQSLEEAAERIRTGASVLLFAEGTRSLDGKLQQFKRGPFNLAIKSGVPVVPVTINGSHKILPKHSTRIQPGIIRLVLSNPIEPPKEFGKETELSLRDKIREIIQNNLSE